MRLTLGLVVILSVIIRGSGLNCYVCSWAADDKECGDAGFALYPDMAMHFMINCSVCYKKVIYNATGAKQRILRGCNMKNDEMAYMPICQETRYINGNWREICACSTDYCNNNDTLSNQVAPAQLKCLNNDTLKVAPAALKCERDVSPPTCNAPSILAMLLLALLCIHA